MKFKNFDDFFLEATGEKHFPYQAEFANAPELFELVHAPTGAGKTAMAILGWLWRRRFAENDVQRSTPRRLVYCLPMRSLVEQTRDAAIHWLDKLGLNNEIKVHALMGGEVGEEWDLSPERDTILIGTQDMLLSRALNRGYGMSRFRWPMHFGLLNNDCLWVLDEVQLMGVGLATSTQLEAFRRSFGVYGPADTVWMSATLLPEWLRTVDFRHQIQTLKALSLTDADYNAPGLKDRWIAKKPIEQAEATADDTGAIAAQIKEVHHPNSLTLVVVNRVDRARALFVALEKAMTQKKARGQGKTTSPVNEQTEQAPDIKLIHSRFRPNVRKAWKDWLKPPWPDRGRIIISTQIVEAGVDLSARVLFTELAPWPSLVQRFGRCNRMGEFIDEEPSRVYWIDVPAKDDKQAAPYSKSELDHARGNLRKQADVGLRSLHDFFEALPDASRAALFPFEPMQVIRRRDIVGLFDTTPDLSGNDIDVSPFIREGDERDVQVFWRDVGPQGPTEFESSPHRLELCNVPIGDIKAFLDNSGNRVGYLWDHLDSKWKRIRDPIRELRPGLMIMLPAGSGGYTVLGWDINSKSAVAPVPIEVLEPPEGTGDDPNSRGPALTIAEHTQNVCDHLDKLLSRIDGLPAGWSEFLLRAARWHDCGKAHDAFQHGMRSANPLLDRAKLWAKSGVNGPLRHSRRHFRHELASALAVLQHDLPFEVAYLVAAHHGKFRLSIRSLPEEDQPKDPGALFAHGVHDRDPMRAVDLPGESCRALTLDLSPMQLGGEGSWTGRALGLRDAFGPFRLAYLETILRSADLRASKAERLGEEHA